MRRAAALAFIPLLAAVAVAGCGSSSSSKPTPSSSASSSASSASYTSVAVSGAFNKAPKVTIPKETGSGALFTKTLIQGSGAATTSTEGVIGNYVAYDWSGKTSKVIATSYGQSSPSVFVKQLVPPGVATALQGQKVGSRVLAVIPPAQGFGTSGDPSMGIGSNDTLVFVVDILSTFSTSSVPGTQTTNGGGALPTVIPPTANGTAGPTIKIPANATAPKTLTVKTLIKGKGAVVKAGQEIFVQYVGVNWRTGKVFDSSWTDGQPLPTVIGEGQVIKGWDTGLVGQTVGSRVLLIIPPADGYGSAGQSQAGIKGTDTLVFSIDILAAD
jgi:FKBP-type peptidyl-prolyl cis-trans isomerase